MNKLEQIKKQLRRSANSIQAKNLQRFFKTGKGEYGFGDVFIGMKVPDIRRVVKKHKDTESPIIEKLIKSEIHEERLCGLLILVLRYELGDEFQQEKMANIYLKHKRHINNWDLIDLTAHKILGHYLIDRPKEILYKLSRSESVWDRRIAILATFYFIKQNKYTNSLKLAKILIEDRHDLIHKAVGWMLREVGNRSPETEEIFLKKYYKKMPRTMLRYAIEKFPEDKRLAYLHGEI